MKLRNKIVSIIVSLALIIAPFNVVEAEEILEPQLEIVDILEDTENEESKGSFDDLPGVYPYEAKKVIEEIKVIEEPYISEAELQIIAMITMAEAENEPEYGKRLVIDTILNRVDSDKFPDTIIDVATQPNQYTSMNSDRMSRCYVRNDIYQLVIEEFESRTDYDVIFFTSNGYSQYGTPMFQICCHSFSSL